MNEWENTTALFALDARPLEPSAQLRDRILASVRAEGRAQSFIDHAERRAERLVPPRVTRVDPKVIGFERPPRAVGWSFGSFGAIAAALVFVTLIISLVVLWQQNRATQNELARLSTEMQQAEAQLKHERGVVELLTSSDTHMAKLSGTSVAPGAHAMLAYDKNGHAMLMAKGLPATPKGMAYQLWYIKDNQKMPGRMFTPDAAGNGLLEDQVPTVARDKAVFAITLEPERGVQSPTGSVYLVSAS
jgi:hypothetical protein